MSLFERVLIVCGIIVIGYIIVRVFSWAVFSSYYDVRNKHLKNMIKKTRRFYEKKQEENEGSIREKVKDRTKT